MASSIASEVSCAAAWSWFAAALAASALVKSAFTKAWAAW